MNKRQKQRIGLVLAFAVLTYFASYLPKESTNSKSANHTVQKLYKQHLNHVQIETSGTVIKLLADDTKGSKHQRFIVKTDNKQTILIVHNIDLAPRIDALKVGTHISIYGEYIWTKQGGLIHWTHHDPDNKHPHGWIRYQGQLYQ